MHVVASKYSQVSQVRSSSIAVCWKGGKSILFYLDWNSTISMCLGAAVRHASCRYTSQRQTFNVRNPNVESDYR